MRDGDSSEVGYIIMALQILMEVQEMDLVQEEILKSRGSGRKKEGSPQLDVCARVIREHLCGMALRDMVEERGFVVTGFGTP